MTGRIFVITGANSGIGFEAAKYLAEGGNHVILACRSQEKGEAAVEKIRKDNARAMVTFLELDVADFDSIRKFVNEFKSRFQSLNGLINNAGIADFKSKEVVRNKDGYEITMMTNHIGHVLLTSLLVDSLAQGVATSGSGRIVNVASTLHNMEENPRMMKNIQKLDLDNFFLDNAPEDFNGLQAYKNSKLCQILYTYKLAEELESKGIAVNAVCPGFIPSTNLSRTSPRHTRCFLVCCFHFCLRPLDITRTPQQGGRLVADLSYHERFQGCNGLFIRDYYKDHSSSESYDKELQQRVWDLTLDLIRRVGTGLTSPVTPEMAVREF